jgi:hypothetical protein
MMSSSVEACAARGAALLDKKRPYWAELVSVTSLDMTNTGKCVLGQVYGHYAEGLRDLFGDAAQDMELSDYHGFSAFGATVVCTVVMSDAHRATWDELGHAWRAEIARRRISARRGPLFLAQDEVTLSA